MAVSVSSLLTVKLTNYNLRVAFIALPGCLSLKYMLNSQPVFLAADILSTKKYSHVHAKYAKAGMACKVILSGSRLEGLSCTSGGLWFYTIQGLFKAAFEHGDLTLQTDCLRLLQEVWIQYSTMAPLPSSLTVSLHSDATQSANSPQPVLHSIKHLFGLDTGNLSTEISSCSNNSVQEVSRLDSNDSDRSKVTNDTSSPIAPECQSLADNPEQHPSYTDSFPTESCAEVTVLSSETASQDNMISSSPLPAHKRVDPVLEVIHSLCRTVRGRINYSDHYAQPLKTLLGLIEAFKYDYSSSYLVNGFPYHLLESYAVVAQDKQLCKNYSADCGFSLPRSKSLLLYLICEWLGREFASLLPHITKRAAEFKLEHMKAIDSLPPPQQLVSRLFPQCMLVLLRGWMEPREKDTQCTDESAKRRCPESSVYPFIQLILEFANNTLVSGVAHVLYTRLLQSSN